MDEYDDPRPCAGRNVNVCVAEGCYNEGCLLNNTREEYDRRKRIMNNEELDDLLRQTLEKIDLQIAWLENQAAQMNILPHELQDANGGWQMIPLLLAKAQLLSVMGKERPKNIHFNPQHQEVEVIPAHYENFVRMTGLSYRTIKELQATGWEFSEMVDAMRDHITFTLTRTLPIAYEPLT